MKPYDKLQRFWGEPPIADPSRGATVEALERRYRLHLPGDFREYLLHSSFNDWDENCTAWWPLDRIKNIPDEYDHCVSLDAVARNAQTYLFFADYSIWCWAWAIACGDDENRGRIVCIYGQDRLVAESFSQFVDLYLKDAHSLV